MLSEQLKVSQLVNYSKEQMKNRLEEIQVYSIMKNTMDEKGVFKMGQVIEVDNEDSESDRNYGKI